MDQNSRLQAASEADTERLPTVTEVNGELIFADTVKGTSDPNDNFEDGDHLVIVGDTIRVSTITRTC